ncbi:hypothetical protein UPYG_G00201260 [Umbra pygmaea]|uniref:C2H2-type domain-containing protein n=1 Tax=Umbra pygmaea TaxID=75934 RepID=A0ABD0WI97_UMBPY
MDSVFHYQPVTAAIDSDGNIMQPDSKQDVEYCEKEFTEKSQSSLTPDGQVSHQIENSDVMMNSTLLSESTDSILQVEIYDKYQAIWSADEVHALLTSWSSRSVQKELLSTMRNTRVFARVSSELAALGFKKTTKQCREKIKKLKQDYKKIKNDTSKNCPNSCGRRWFAFMDEVLSQQTRTQVLLETTNQPWTEDSDEYQSIWSADEVNALVTSWSSRSVQKELLSTVRNTRVFARISSELAALGFKKTTNQCRWKIKKLKQDYKKMKNDTSKDCSNLCGRRWFDIMDAVLSEQTGTPVLLEQTEDSDNIREKSLSILTPDSQVSHQTENSDVMMNSTLLSESTDSILQVETSGEYQAIWSADEVHALLTFWSSRSVQKELLSSMTNTRVFARVSSELAALGFKKTTNQCRWKIKKLKEEYRKIKNGPGKSCSNSLGKRLFDIMDAVLSQQTVTPVLLETTNRPATEDSGPQLPLPSLRLLAPPLRLMSAFMWQVSQQNNVKHYGKLEEFVTLVTEIVPEVLSSRQRTNLLLGLRAKMVLELCQTESTVDVETIQNHLDKIHTLIECYVEKESIDELDITVSNFPDLVQSLLKDPSEREHFFQEVFPVHYGPHYDTALQTLVWEFLSQLEELLPVPDFTQTAAWLGSASSVLEECENTLLDPEAIKTLLQHHHHHHHHHHGNLKKNYFTHFTTDTILCTLSIPPTVKDVIGSEQEASLDQTTCGEERGQPNGGQYEMDNEEQGQKEEGSNHRNDEPGTDKPLPPSSTQQIPCAPIIRSYKCTYCGKLFPHFNILHSHIKTHKLPFHCHKCKKRFSSTNQLEIHQIIHTGEMLFKCSQCGRRFKHKTALQYHVSTHTSHPHCCSVCGKMVTNLRHHMQVHTRERKYVCSVCGKVLLSSAGLKIHTRSHTGEYPYLCDYCGKGYTSLAALKWHMPSHTGERPYSCNLCSKRFLSAYSVKTHKLSHICTTFYECFKCGKSFVLKKHLKAHVKSH